MSGRAVTPGAADLDPNVERAAAIGGFLIEARRRFQMIADAESGVRRRMKDDLEFSQGEPFQWRPEDVADRVRDGRPCLTINRLNGPIKQVTNQQRSSRPAIQVNPVDDGADTETAEILQGLIRRIELQSDADIVYATAGDHQVRMGRGYWYVVAEFADDHSFEQELKLRRVRNPFSVYMDPACQQADKSDARFGFVIEDMPRDEYRSVYPNSQLASLIRFTGIGNVPPDWMPEGNVRIASYYYVDIEVSELAFVELPDGSFQTVPSDQLIPVPPEMKPASHVLDETASDDREYAFLDTPQPEPQPVQTPDGQWAMPPEPPPVMVIVHGRRPLETRKVKYCKINGVEILEGNADKSAGQDWPGKYVPIVEVIGDEFDIDGRVDLRGMVRDAKDSQRMSNYWKTSMTEQIALASKAPYIGYAGQFENFEDQWALANRKNFPYLEVNLMPLGNGQSAPIPQRQPGPGGTAIQAMVYGVQQTENDLRATTGYFDVQAAESRPEQSGKAILARQKQGEIASSNYMDNLGFAIRHTGRILLDLIPHFYDRPRIRRIIGADNQEKTVAMHAGRLPLDPQTKQPITGEQLQQYMQAQSATAIDRIYDLSLGRYDVTISVGPSTQSKRTEATEAMLQVIQSRPDAFEIMGDLLFENMDWPYAKVIAKRLKSRLPPGMQDDGKADPAAQVPQLQQQLQQAQQELKVLQQQIQTKQVEAQADLKLAQLDIQSRERIAQINAQVNLTATQAKIQADQAATMIEMKFKELEQQLTRTHEARMAAQAMLHEQETARQNRGHEVASAAADAHHTLTQQQADHLHDVRAAVLQRNLNPPVEPTSRTGDNTETM